MFCSASYAQQKNDIIGKSDGAVRSVAWNTDGTLFATGGNRFVVFWFAETNTTKSFLTENEAPIISSSFSKNGKWFLSLGDNNTVIVREIENKYPPTKIVVTTPEAVNDVVFTAEDGLSFALPVDGRTIVSFYRLIATQEFVQKKLYEAPSNITHLDINKSFTRMLIETKDGRNLIINTDNGELYQDVPRYSGSNVKPRFSPDGKKWVAATDKFNLSISDVYRIGGKVIRDSDKFVNAAVFSPDSMYVAAATAAGTVKVFNAESGEQENIFYLVDGKDVVTSLAYSPDGEFILAGTELGYTYRWSLSGKVFDEKEKKYIEKPDSKSNQSKEKKEQKESSDQSSPAPNEVNPAPVQEQGTAPAAGEGQGGTVAGGEKETQGLFSKKLLKTLTKDCPDDSVNLEISYNTLPQYYIGSFNLGAGYRRYDFNPCYMVFDTTLGFAPVSSDFPYSYKIRGQRMNKPILYSVSTSVGAGLSYYNYVTEVLLFTELHAGPSVHFMSNSEPARLVVSKPVYSFYTDLIAGVQWQSLRLGAGVEYDSNFNMLFKTVFSVSQKWRLRSRYDKK